MPMAWPGTTSLRSIPRNEPTQLAMYLGRAASRMQRAILAVQYVHNTYVYLEHRHSGRRPDLAGSPTVAHATASGNVGSRPLGRRTRLVVHRLLQDWMALDGQHTSLSTPLTTHLIRPSGNACLHSRELFLAALRQWPGRPAVGPAAQPCVFLPRPEHTLH